METLRKIADDFMNRLDSLKKYDVPDVEIDSLKKDLNAKIFDRKIHDYTYVEKICEIKDVDMLHEELVFTDLFLDAACSLIQEVYDKSIQKGQIAISDKIERVVKNDPWGWPIDKIKFVDWQNLSQTEKLKLGKNDARTERRNYSF